MFLSSFIGCVTTPRASLQTLASNSLATNRPKKNFVLIIMKALKCKPSAQIAYNYTINVSSKCGNIISHRSSGFEGRHNAIDLRRSAHRSSIFESRHIDLRRLKAETSHRQPNIAPTFREFVTEHCRPRYSIIILPKILRCIYVLYI